MVSACHTKVVQKHLSFLKLFQWTVKRFVSRKVTEVCYSHSFFFHCISVPKSAGELRLLGMEIKQHFLMLPENQVTLSLQTLQFFSTRCGTTHDVPQMQYPLWGSGDSVRNRQVSREFWLVGWVCLCCWACYYSVNCWQLSISLVPIPHGSTFTLPSVSSLFHRYEGW